MNKILLINFAALGKLGRKVYQKALDKIGKTGKMIADTTIGKYNSTLPTAHERPAKLH